MKSRIAACLNGLKMKWKLFLCFFLVTVVSMGIVTVSIYYATKKSLMEQSYGSMDTSLQQANVNLQNTLDIYENISNMVCMNRYVENYMSFDYSRQGIEDMYAYMDDYFQGILLLHPSLVRISVETDNPTVPRDQYYFYYLDDSVKKQSWYKRLDANSNQSRYGSLVRNSDGTYSISLVQNIEPVIGAATRNILCLDIDEQVVYSSIEKLGSDGLGFVLDGDGQILSCKNRDEIGRKFSDVIKIPSGELQDGGWTDVTVDGDGMLAASRTMSNGWRTVLLVHSGIFSQKAAQSASYVAWAFLAGLVAAAFLISGMSSFLTKRIKVLTGRVRSVRDGNFNISAEGMGSDEIGELAGAFSAMSRRIQTLIQDVYRKELTRRQAEINLLQEQINPHFLYNSLSSISYLAIRRGDGRTGEMVRSLSEFYRISLNKGKDILPIRDEIRLTQDYVAVQKIRFGDMLDVRFQLDENLLDYKTIKLLLQPFLENSISHAMGEGCLRVTVRLYAVRNGIAFEVEDDGLGMDEATLNSLRSDIRNESEGYGFKNVNVRIKLNYGKDYGVSVRSEPGQGTCVTILIPYVK